MKTLIAALCLLVVLASTSAMATQEPTNEDCNASWNEVDVDSSGKLTPQELKRFDKEILGKTDKDGDGGLSPEEYKDACISKFWKIHPV